MTMQERQKTEALDRLAQLEKLYGLNPNVRKYFADGKLYYSYLTCGGMMGSIDTITYDPNYARIAQAVEEQQDVLVYHAIESNGTLSLLYVSDDAARWEAERPTRKGVMAMVVDVNTGKGKCGCIGLDALQGALYRTSNQVSNNQTVSGNTSHSLKDEIKMRIGILKEQGLMTDLDIENLYLQANEICFSEGMDLGRMIPGLSGEIGIVNRISAKPQYEKIYKVLSKQIPYTIYFMLVGKNRKLAFLIASDEPEIWSTEKELLRKKITMACVVDLDEMKATVEKVEYEILEGGPIWIQ